MFDFFSLEIAKLFKCAEEEMYDLRHPYVGTEHLLLAILKKDKNISNITTHYDLSYDTFKNELLMIIGSAKKKSTYVLYTPLLKKVIKDAIELSKKEEQVLNARHLFISILDEGEGIAIRLLMGMGINIESLYDDLKITSKNKTKKLELLNIGKNINDTVAMDELVVGRDKEINQIIEVLIRKNKNNPLLIGQAGVGKTAIIEELARRINNGTIVDSLRNKRIIMLEMGSLVAGTKYRGEFEEKLNKIIKEIESNPEYILFIDEVHTMVNAGGAEGAINASDILKPYLARNTIKCIGATTTYEYEKYISKDKALSRRFEIINIEEPSLDDTKNILNKVKKSYEKHYKIKITKENVNDIVDLTNEYIYCKKNPDKSLDILDSLCANLSIKNNYNKEVEQLKISNRKLEEEKEICIKTNDYKKAIEIIEIIKNNNEEINKINKKKNLKITKVDIIDIIYQKCNIPNNIEKEKMFYKLKDSLIKKEYDTLKIINYLENNYFNNNGMSVLLNGKINDKKIDMVNIIIKELKMPLLRIDALDYETSESINKLIGTPAGYIGYDDEVIINKFKNISYGCILIENIECASDTFKKFCKQILDKRMITNAKGEEINLKNIFIIFTSNIKKRNSLGFNNEEVNSNDLLNELNIDEIIDFSPINQKVVA